MAEKQKGFDLAAALGSVSNLDTGIEGREQLKYIDLALIHPDPNNFYSLDGLDELAGNIELIGLQQPLRVRPDPDHEGEYIIVSGHRRRAAIELLVKEDKFGLVPCLIEGHQESEAMRKLRLIFANSSTRKLSSADLSKQAEEVETLLYQLKAEGTEFPGRMRAHVAEACGVKETKLARLKVIRENLDGEMKEQWEAGKINESEAYNLAKLPPEHRAVIWAHKGNHSWNYAGARAVEEFGKRLEKVDASVAPDAIPDSCPVGYCANLEMRWEASLRDGIYGGSRCEQCCHNCRDIGSCKYACPSLASEIAKAKQAKKDERKAQKERAEEENRPTIELLTKLWQRFGEARQWGHISLDKLYCLDSFYPRPVESDYLPKERGTATIKSADYPPFGFSVSLSAIRLLCRIADTLGCSIDYLLCRTDDPDGGVPADLNKPKWMTNKPQHPGKYYTRVETDGITLCTMLHWRDGWGIVNGKVTGWWPLPAEKDAEDIETPEDQ